MQERGPAQRRRQTFTGSRISPRSEVCASFDAGAGRWFCTSHSDPVRAPRGDRVQLRLPGLHRPSALQPSCALLAHLGWLPEVEPDLPYVEASPADCPDCSGCGVQTFRNGAQPCETCRGSGLKPDHRLRDVPAVEIVATVAA